MWPFRPPQTPVDAPKASQTTLDLIEQVASLRGQVRAMETEWDDIREQIKKGYQRMEKSNQRRERRESEDEPPQEVQPVPQQIELHGFAKKLAERARQQ